MKVVLSKNPNTIAVTVIQTLINQVGVFRMVLMKFNMLFT